MKEKKKTAPVLGSKLAKKSKLLGASLTIAKQLGLEKVGSAAAHSSVALIPRTNSPLLKKKDTRTTLKGVAAGKVIKKATLHKQQGKKLVKRAKQSKAQSRLRPATRALTAHIESQKLELAKAGAEDYELLTTDDVIILSSSSESSPSRPAKSTKRLSQVGTDDGPQSKKQKGLVKASETPTELRKTRCKTSASPVSTRSKTPSTANQEKQSSSKGSAANSGRKHVPNVDIGGSGVKPKAAKQLIKSLGPGRPKLSGKDSPAISKTQSPGIVPVNHTMFSYFPKQMWCNAVIATIFPIRGQLNKDLFSLFFFRIHQTEANYTQRVV